MMEPEDTRRFSRHVKAMCAKADDAEGFAQAVALLDELHAELSVAAQRLNAEGFSWTELSRPLGVSRQGVRQRFAAKAAS